MGYGIFYCRESDNIKKLECNLDKSQVFAIELEGSTIHDRADFFHVISRECGFPFACNGFDGYLDWIRDLSWINQNRIAIIIRERDKFMTDDIEGLGIFYETMLNVVFPWWDHEVVDCVVGGKAKEFSVFLLD